MDGEESPDEVPLELRLWIDEGLSEEQRSAMASASWDDDADYDEEWLADLGWPAWNGTCASLTDDLREAW